MRQIKSLPCGFTLLELMMVLLLVGLSVSSISLSVNPHSKSVSGMALEQAQKTADLMREISDETTYTGKTVGLFVAEKTLQFVERVPPQAETSSFSDLHSRIIARITAYDRMKWAVLTRPSRGESMVSVPDGTEISLQLGGLELDTSSDRTSLERFNLDGMESDEIKPQILFYPTGEMTPFVIDFKVTDGGETHYSRISADGTGQILAEELSNASQR